MTKLTIRWVVLCLTLLSVHTQGQDMKQELTDFQNDKFGLFVHWGLYSAAGGVWKGVPAKGGEHFMLYERIPLKEYAQMADSFYPVDFNAEEWVKKAKYAGMKYIVYTAKHHEGFAMYNSSCSNYNIVKRTPFGRDPLKELAEACAKEGMKLGVYYSLGRDWEDPDVPTNWPQKAGRSNTWDYPDEDAKDLSKYFNRKVIPQIKELLTGYGPITMLWFDTPELITKEQSRELRALIKSIQPHCLINMRIGNGQGDYAIVEQKLVDKIRVNPWEACMTMGKNWGYNRYDTLYKSNEELIRHFTDIVSKGGNLLLNVGPTGQGDFPTYSDAVFQGFHDWLATNGEALYGTRPWRTFGETVGQASYTQSTGTFNDAEYDGTPKDRTEDLRFTCNGNTLYVIVRHVRSRRFTIRSIIPTDRVSSVKPLDKSRSCQWKQKPDGLHVTLSGKSTFPIYVLAVSLQKE